VTLGAQAFVDFSKKTLELDVAVMEAAEYRLFESSSQFGEFTGKIFEIYGKWTNTQAGEGRGRGFAAMMYSPRPRQSTKLACGLRFLMPSFSSPRARTCLGCQLLQMHSV
jgi:hypothetical protein